jgi:predicted nuclease with TOPRIM domain
MLKHYLEQRLQTLQTEFQAGQTMLAELEAKQANLRETLLRMSGAIQVLQECLQETEAHIPLEENERETEENGNPVYSHPI